MLVRRFGTFSGGIDLPEEKQATLEAPIAPAGVMARLAVPLAPVSASPAEPVAKTGQRVVRGQLLAKASDEKQVDVFAPLGGQVGAMVEAVLADQHTGWRKTPALELLELDEPTGIKPLQSAHDWRSAEAESLRRRITDGQLLTCRVPVTSLARWVAAARQARADTLILNVMENTPFVTADHRLLAERGWEVVRGLAILARALELTNVVLAVDGRRTEAYRAVVGPAKLYGIDALALAHKYPIGADAILLKVLTRREVPPGGSDVDVGVAVTDAATCWAAYRWVACDERQTSRVVTVAGEHAPRPGNFLVPFGADVGKILTWAGAGGDHTAIYGPAMTGRLAVEGATVAADTNALLAHSLPRAAPSTPCIRCGWCSENCPARLNVPAINDDFELGRARRAMRRGALACIDCGICSYVCPARLPLAHRLAALKRVIVDGREKPAHATST